MGKKISVDSSTLMNKVFEVIEAKKIFDLNYNQIDILIHPDSYIHALVEFKNNMISIIAHKTTMDIPIFNSLYNNQIREFNKESSINLQKLNNLSFKNVNKSKFPLIKILNKLPKNSSLFETALVEANDQLVELYLQRKIKYNQISYNLIKLTNFREIESFKKKTPKNIGEILQISSYVRRKVKNMCQN